MPSLQVRELPEQIYNKLQALARKEHRSFSQQAIVTIAKGLTLDENHKKRRAELLNHILNNPIEIKGNNISDPAKLVREDRNR
ncbi:MAG: hypothetical protein JRH15_18110 [Deltaproteobacteria bacterium]|nr:hypothetical protein [Deltaproteobacteria bacterium]